MASELEQMLMEVNSFSEQVRGGPMQHEVDRRDWTKRYLLSAHRELSDMLDALPGWKEHRRESAPAEADVDALTEQACDVINYVLATLGLWDVSADDLNRVWRAKMNVLWHRRTQEVVNPIQPGETIAMLDLDGVLADFRRGFLDWASRAGGYSWADSRNDPAGDLRLDVDLGIEPALYRDLKYQFEREGGYGKLPVFCHADHLIAEIVDQGWRPVFLTSRPETPARTYRDTLSWLLDAFPVLGSLTFTLVFTRRKAEWLRDCGGEVAVCVEDDPAQIGRLSAQGYRVLVPEHPYNASVRSTDLVSRLPLHHLVKEVRWSKRLGSESLPAEGAVHEHT